MNDPKITIEIDPNPKLPPPVTFIRISGPICSGKTTYAQMIERILTEAGITVEVVDSDVNDGSFPQNDPNQSMRLNALGSKKARVVISTQQLIYNLESP